MIEYFANSKDPVPEVLTAEEACRFLRLDEDRDMEQASRALQRLVDKRLLHPCRLGRHNRFTRQELSRLVKDLTEQSSAR